MTAPPTYSGGTTAQYQRRRPQQRTGATGSPGGDGSYDANGVMRPPAAPGMPGETTQTAPHHQPPGGTSAPGAPQQHYQQTGQHGPAGMTFAQMQSQGYARPNPAAPQAPPQAGAGDLGGQLQNSVSAALSNPSRYQLPQVEQVRSALTQQLQQQFGGQRKQLDEEMARRGLGASSIGAGYYGDLQGQQDTALANMNADLIKDFAGTQAADQSAALGAGQNYQNSLNANQLATAGLTGQYGGQDTLAAQQLKQSGSQFNIQQALAEKLGLGNLGVQQGQLDLSKSQLGQQNTQFNTQQALAEKLGLGNLGLQQGNLDLQNKQLTQQGTQFDTQQALAKMLGLGNLDLQNKQLTQSGTQFDSQQALAKMLGLGNLDVQNKQLAQSGTQFQDQLAQSLKLGTMSDATANRGIDAQEALAKNDLMMKIMSMLGNVDLSKFLGGGSGGTGPTGPTGPTDDPYGFNNGGFSNNPKPTPKTDTPPGPAGPTNDQYGTLGNIFNQMTGRSMTAQEKQSLGPLISQYSWDQIGQIIQQSYGGK